MRRAAWPRSSRTATTSIVRPQAFRRKLMRPAAGNLQVTFSGGDVHDIEPSGSPTFTTARRFAYTVATVRADR